MHRQVGLLVATAVFVLTALTLYSTAFTHRSLAEGEKKSLDIRRHRDEPLELVDLRISGKSLKSKIKTKSRLQDNRKEGLDTVDFNSDDDWLRQLTFKVRNTSSRRITGLSAYLYFSPGDPLRLFRATLKGPSGPLERAVLEPNEQIDVLVDTNSLDRAIMRLRAYGGDPAQATVSISIEMVAFSDGIMWRRGSFVQKDPANPNKWIPVRSKSPPAQGRFNHGFRSNGYFDEDSLRRSGSKNSSSILTPRSPQDSRRCVIDNDTGLYGECGAPDASRFLS